MKKSAIMTAIIASPARSAWARGVKAYALDILQDIDTEGGITERTLLNGARDWHQYSNGGSALIYSGDIAARLCTPSELKRTHYGMRTPNARETWLDVQARALYQAGILIKQAAESVRHAEPNPAAALAATA